MLLVAYLYLVRMLNHILDSDRILLLSFFRAFFRRIATSNIHHSNKNKRTKCADKMAARIMSLVFLYQMDFRNVIDYNNLHNSNAMYNLHLIIHHNPRPEDYHLRNIHLLRDNFHHNTFL